MTDRELPMNFGQYLILDILPRLREKGMFGKPFIRLGTVFTLSGWLYETGAVLGRFWKDKIPVVYSMFEVEDKREEFTQYWHDQARNRLEKYGGQPRTFTIFVLQTDLDILMGKKLEDLEPKDFVKIGEKKLSPNEGNQWLRLIETSMIEGIMFGSLYPDLTHIMLVNEYEKIDVDSWKEARKYGVTLSEKPPQMTVEDKEKEAVEMARDYVMEYHRGLMTDLSLG
jgi:hypothetical protein